MCVHGSVGELWEVLKHDIKLSMAHVGAGQWVGPTIRQILLHGEKNAGFKGFWRPVYQSKMLRWALPGHTVVRHARKNGVDGVLSG